MAIGPKVGYTTIHDNLPRPIYEIAPTAGKTCVISRRELDKISIQMGKDPAQVIDLNGHPNISLMWCDDNEIKPCLFPVNSSVQIENNTCHFQEELPLNRFTYTFWRYACWLSQYSYDPNHRVYHYNETFLINSNSRIQVIDTSDWHEYHLKTRTY